MHGLTIWMLCALALFTAPAQAGTGGGFTIGVPPTHSPRMLVKRYEPLRAHLQARLGKQARVETAADFARFQQRTLRGDFDLTITPAHFSRLAQQDAGFQPLAHLLPDHDALLVVSAARPEINLHELRGKDFAVIDRRAITVMAVLHYLASQGLEADRDYRVVEHRTHASVAQAIATGLAAGGVSTTQGLLQVSPDLRARVHVQRHIADIPAFILLAPPALAREEVERLRELLLDFASQPAGRQFLANIGYTSLHPASEATMKRSDPFLDATRKALK